MRNHEVGDRQQEEVATGSVGAVAKVTQALNASSSIAAMGWMAGVAPGNEVGIRHANGPEEKPEVRR